MNSNAFDRLPTDAATRAQAEERQRIRDAEDLNAMERRAYRRLEAFDEAEYQRGRGGAPDPELPRGYQDADLEMADMEAAADEAAALARRGICSHWWRLSRGHTYSLEQIAEQHARGEFPTRPVDERPLPVGRDLCLDCGAHVEALVFAS